MTCKDCIHYDLCRSCSRIQLGWHGNSVHYVENIEEICKDFKDRSRFVELPCKVGNRVYFNNIHIKYADVIGIYIDAFGGVLDLRVFTNVPIPNGFGYEYFISKDYTFEDIGKRLFLTKESAEQALKERENGA